MGEWICIRAGGPSWKSPPAWNQLLPVALLLIVEASHSSHFCFAIIPLAATALIQRFTISVVIQRIFLKALSTFNNYPVIKEYFFVKLVGSAGCFDKPLIRLQACPINFHLSALSLFV